MYLIVSARILCFLIHLSELSELLGSVHVSLQPDNPEPSKDTHSFVGVGFPNQR